MLQSIEILAVISAALYGVLLATRKQLDFVGVFSVACILAFAGGTLRDLFLDRHPLFWIANDHYVIVVFGLALFGSVFARWVAKLERFLAIPDTLGLALYSLTGAGYALESGTSMVIACLMGVITGTFGGVVAETICNEIPSLFSTTPLYATCAFVGIWVYMGLQEAGVHPTYSLLAGGTVICVFRWVALWRGWCLPNATSPDR